MVSSAIGKTGLRDVHSAANQRAPCLPCCDGGVSRRLPGDADKGSAGEAERRIEQPSLGGIVVDGTAAQRRKRHPPSLCNRHHFGRLHDRVVEHECDKGAGVLVHHLAVDRPHPDRHKAARFDLARKGVDGLRCVPNRRRGRFASGKAECSERGHRGERGVPRERNQRAARAEDTESCSPPRGTVGEQEDAKGRQHGVEAVVGVPRESLAVGDRSLDPRPHILWLCCELALKGLHHSRGEVRGHHMVPTSGRRKGHGPTATRHIETSGTRWQACVLHCLRCELGSQWVRRICIRRTLLVPSSRVHDSVRARQPACVYGILRGCCFGKYLQALRVVVGLRKRPRVADDRWLF
eukprot:m.123326 g.123326  ORF g.123326 m.123326 type:complete len:351 (-) comp22009_c0_seq1:3-1055(-)